MEGPYRRVRLNAGLGVIAYDALDSTLAPERNSYTKRNHGAQNKRVHKNERPWRDTSEYRVAKICD